MKIDSNDEDSINKNQKNTEIPEEEETIFDIRSLLIVIIIYYTH